MILSHKHKFIFIKTVKTAGTSIEIALSRFCGENDIITPISPQDEDLRRGLGYPGPRNYSIAFRRYSPSDWVHAIKRRRRVVFRNHAPAPFVKRHVDRAVWDSYYKFCFERNPWDKVISYYYWKHRDEPRPSLSDFVHGREAGRIPGYDLYAKGGVVLVDQVFLYERLDEAMTEIAERCGLPEVPELVHAKGGFRGDKRNHRELLSAGDRERIASAYAREISLLGYQW